MSNYISKAKKPNGKEFERIEMLDDLFTPHIYGVRFPDGETYR